MEELSKRTFCEKIFDYEKKKEWEFQGSLPAIIDFYADWCGPCKMVSPILEILAIEYKGKVDMFKVNTDKEQELSTAFGIMTIPSLMFIPKTGQPQMARGALDRQGFVKMIQEILGVK
ncbi:MAG: thioredoxin [Candidatus Aminicenantes bacterium]|nr:thioredoxin [Candidatus Aminicenantes bacterium]